MKKYAMCPSELLAMYGLLSRIANLAQMRDESTRILTRGGPAVRDLCDLLSSSPRPILIPLALLLSSPEALS